MAEVPTLQIKYPRLCVSYDPGSLLTINITDQAAVPREVVSPGKQYHLAIVSDHFSLVPNTYFTTELEKNYLLDLGMPAGVNFKSTPIDDWSAQLVFSLENHPDNLGNACIHSIWEPLFRYSWHLFNQTYAPALYVHLTPDFICIIGGEKGQLHFFNQFNVITSEDHLYFILRTVQDWNKDPHLLDVYLSGHYLDDSPLYDLLDQYLGRLIPAPVFFEPLSGLEDHPDYQFADLRSFAACV
jgi:hypothetical protein